MEDLNDPADRMQRIIDSLDRDQKERDPKMGWWRGRLSAAQCLKLGQILVELKDTVKHGEFIPRLTALGIDNRLAQRLMKAATLFSSPEMKRVVSAAGSQSKLLELLTLDPADLGRLAEGREVLGLTLGRIKSIGVIALREALHVVDVPDAMFLSAEERLLLGNFRRCDRDGREHVAQTARLLAR